MSQRQQWNSQLGFILAAAGSAIGLGNIVFFSANAYRFGAGAFYIPYLLSLFCVGLPVMILEFGLGKRYQRSFPLALREVGGVKGEVLGWFALFNAMVITTYYSTILAWVAGMWWYSVVGTLFEPSIAVPAFGLAQGEMANPHASFFDFLSSWGVLLAVAIVWAFNFLGLYWGTKSIERIVKAMMPFIWIAMIGFIVLGLSLDGGIHGAYLLFKPEFDVMMSPKVWNGAAAQIFFTLSLGFGIMTAYSSYLPRKTDHTSNAVVVSMMNSTFEMIAGLAIFSLLFVYSLTPQASTLGMMFFVIPKAIGALPFAAQLLGSLFFTLLFCAGMTSSISLLEATVSGVSDRFHLNRKKVLTALSAIGTVGSAVFALPHVIDPGIQSNGTLGLSFLDLMDHYSFSYGLLIVGVLECILIGWFLPVKTLREELNSSSSIKIGPWFDWLVKVVIPVVLSGIIVSTALDDLGSLASNGDGLRVYGDTMQLGNWSFLPSLTPLLWLVGTLGVALTLTYLARNRRRESPETTENEA